MNESIQSYAREVSRELLADALENGDVAATARDILRSIVAGYNAALVDIGADECAPDLLAPGRILGAMMGAIKSPKKASAAKSNGAKGGRPPGKPGKYPVNRRKKTPQA